MDGFSSSQFSVPSTSELSSSEIILVFLFNSYTIAMTDTREIPLVKALIVHQHLLRDVHGHSQCNPSCNARINNECAQSFFNIRPQVLRCRVEVTEICEAGDITDSNIRDTIKQPHCGSRKNDDKAFWGLFGVNHLDCRDVILQEGNDALINISIRP